MGEKERNSSFFTDVWFLLISGQEKTEKMDKMVSVTLWFIDRFIDLNCLFSYLIKENRFAFYAGRDGRDGINGDVVIHSKWIFYLEGKYFQHEFLHEQKWKGPQGDLIVLKGYR